MNAKYANGKSDFGGGHNVLMVWEGWFGLGGGGGGGGWVVEVELCREIGGL